MKICRKLFFTGVEQNVYGAVLGPAWKLLTGVVSKKTVSVIRNNGEEVRPGFKKNSMLKKKLDASKKTLSMLQKKTVSMLQKKLFRCFKKNCFDASKKTLSMLQKKLCQKKTVTAAANLSTQAPST